MELTDFQLSRIYSQGWNAARKLLAKGICGLDETDGARLNPYRASDGAERWIKGFTEALQGRSVSPPISQGASLWRAGITK